MLNSIHSINHKAMPSIVRGAWISDRDEESDNEETIALFQEINSVFSEAQPDSINSNEMLPVKYPCSFLVDKAYGPPS